MSRNEDILNSIISGEEYTGLPESRIEALLIEIGNLIKSREIVTIEDCNAFLKTGFAKTEKDNIANLPTEVSGTDGEWGIVHCIIENDQYGTGTQMYYPVDGDYSGRAFIRSILNMKTDNPSPGDWGLFVKSDDLSEIRVEPLNDKELIVMNNIIDTLGSPEYISDNMLSNYSDYGLSTSGWYILARIHAKTGVCVKQGFEITGLSNYIEPEKGDTYVDVALSFGASPESKKIEINWGDCVESFVFKATDLAIRNLDHRVTFYIYDIKDYATWNYALTTDTTVVADKQYYTLDNGIYTKASLTVGDPIPDNTYYNHSKLTLDGFPLNISYQSEAIDCPVEIKLPEVDDSGYGAWFEIQMTFTGSYSITCTPSGGAKVSTTFVQPPSEGINMLNMQYHVNKKAWLVANNKWTI